MFCSRPLDGKTGKLGELSKAIVRLSTRSFSHSRATRDLPLGPEKVMLNYPIGLI